MIGWLRLAGCGLAGLLLAACAMSPSAGDSTAPIPSSQPGTSVSARAVEPSATAAPTATLPPPSQHRIGIREVDGQAEFFDRWTDNKFVPRGANYAFVANKGGMTNQLLKVGIYDPARTRADFGRLSVAGYNTVRVFIDACAAGDGCIGAQDNQGLNPAYLDNLKDLLTAAKDARLFVLLTSADLPGQGGYTQEIKSAAGGSFGAQRSSYLLTPAGVQVTRRYWSDLLSGLEERRAPLDAVLGWELLDEEWLPNDQPPLSLAGGEVTTTTGSYEMSDPAQKQQMVADALRHYIREVRAEILGHDPTALVAMGFFAPGSDAARYVDTAALLETSDLDFFDFHAFPGTQPMDALASAFGMGGYQSKPILLGEYGAYRRLYGQIQPAARALSAWAADACSLGFDGWLHWSFNPAGEGVDNLTWGLTDENGYLLDLFAPRSQPDPCAALPVAGDNLAFGKPVDVSRYLAMELPEYAVDENDGSQWGSGALAPQWIEIDLQGTYNISEVRLMVAQWPAGSTLHRVLVRLRGSQEFLLVYEFEGVTKDGDWLVFTPPAPLENVEAIGIRTISSPSMVGWKEIQVRGVPSPPD